jgi:UDP-galactopyranose mutase
VNDASNNALFERYKNAAAKEKNIFFGGRLGEYKYYDMHQIIERALTMVEENWG